MFSSILILYVIATSGGLVLLKLGSASGLPISLSAGKLVTNLNVFNITGLILYVISFLLYIYLISRFQLGYIIPVTAGLVYIAVFTASFFIFDEPFTLIKILGIGCILLGLFLLNQGK